MGGKNTVHSVKVLRTLQTLSGGPSDPKLFGSEIDIMIPEPKDTETSSQERRHALVVERHQKTLYPPKSSALSSKRYRSTSKR
jgi:hypothetical protein